MKSEALHAYFVGVEVCSRLDFVMEVQGRIEMRTCRMDPSLTGDIKKVV
jgi:hypothetical protein